MVEAKVAQIVKRDGSVVAFGPAKIEQAIRKALLAVNQPESLAPDLARRVVAEVEQKFAHQVPRVEDVQDIVEQALMREGYREAAKEYILYRQRRADVRRWKKLIGVYDDLKLSTNAIKVLERRYLLRDEDGSIVETPRQLFRRVAHAVAAVEPKFNPKVSAQAIEDQFYSLMATRQFMPNTPTLMNAGAPLGQLSACFVLPVEDSVVSIFDTLKSMAIIHQSGGGTGFSFSHLRPKGDMVRSTKGVASGPVSFMTIFDQATAVMKQGGKRRGANMGILNADHPDIVEFVLAKTKEDTLLNFNVSVGTPDEFMSAAAKGGNWPLVNPRTRKEAKVIQAKDLLDLIVQCAWQAAEPGMIFLDEVNRRNPTPHLGKLEATNPCGELPLLPYESCNLGSINLGLMVDNGKIDWEKLKQVTITGVRFLDDVIEANQFPLDETARITHGNRKIGLGVMGLADALVKLGIPYDSEEAIDTSEKLIKFIAEEARKASVELAVTRGVFPNYPGSAYDQAGGPRLRNATVLSVAPTGTISIIAGCSSSIEPLFGLVFVREVMEGTRLLEINPLFEQVAHERGFYSDELMARVAQTGSVRQVKEVPEDVRRVFATDWDIAPDWHVKIQAVFQKYVDNSVSKTLNLPKDTTPDTVRRVYEMAYPLGCKGVTVYRYGSRKQQVLYLGGDVPEAGAEPTPYLRVASEYSGGCPYGTCPF